MPRSTFGKSVAWMRNSSAMGSLRSMRVSSSRLPSGQSVNTLKVPDDGMPRLPAAAEEGAPELIAAVEQGKVSVSAADVATAGTDRVQGLLAGFIAIPKRAQPRCWSSY